MPVAAIKYQTSPDGKKLWATAAAEGIKIFKAAGAREAWSGPPGGGQHIMGGTIIGSDRKQSVLNANAQSHEVRNLFVGGPLMRWHSSPQGSWQKTGTP